MSRLVLVRRIAWAGVLLVAGLSIGMLASAKLGEWWAGRSAPPVGGPFELVDTKGNIVSDKTLAGKPFLLFFGFTHCPEVCPTALFELSQALQAMGPKADELRGFFVTVDPDRDTAELLDTYLSSFDKRLSALRGSQEAIDAAVRAYRAYYRKVATKEGGYTIDHTAYIYLMGRRGELFGFIRPDENEEQRLAKLRALAAS